MAKTSLLVPEPGSHFGELRIYHVEDIRYILELLYRNDGSLLLRGARTICHNEAVCPYCDAKIPKSPNYHLCTVQAPRTRDSNPQ